MNDGPTTRERIRAEAAALFRRKGFNGTSMAELAVEVGITKSSLYHHFPSKQALLSEIIELTVNRVAPLVQAVADSELPIEERLCRAVAIHAVEAIHDQDAVACFIEEGRYLAPDLHGPPRRRARRLRAASSGTMFEEGIASGDFLPRMPTSRSRRYSGCATRWCAGTGQAVPTHPNRSRRSSLSSRSAVPRGTARARFIQFEAGSR